MRNSLVGRNASYPGSEFRVSSGSGAGKLSTGEGGISSG